MMMMNHVFIISVILSQFLILTRQPTNIDASNNNYNQYLNYEQTTLKIKQNIQNTNNNDENPSKHAQLQNSGKIFLTQTQQIILIPQKYFDQYPQTLYYTQGNSFYIQEALQVIKQYNQSIHIYSSDENQYVPLTIDVYNTVSNVRYLHLINSSKIITFSVLMSDSIQTQAISNFSSLLIIPKGLKSINQHSCLIWGIYQVILAKRNINSIINKQKQKIDDIIGLSVSLEVELDGNSIKSCTIYNEQKYVCFTNNTIFMFVYSNKQHKLQLYHIFKIQHKCLVNVFQIQDNILAMCDCQDGCYNYEITQSSQLIQKWHISKGSLQNIVSMQMYYNHADCTMVVADSSKITIYNWTPLSITICDIFFNLVQMGQPIYRVQGNTDKFMVTYLNNTKPFRVVYYYDNNIYSLKPFNKILTGIYSSLKQNTIIQLTIDSKLQIRSTNPYNILISYEQFQRTLMITATNTDCTQSTKSISFLIIPVKMNQMYFNKKFYEKQQSYSNQDFSIQLWEIFVSARLTNYTIFIDSQSPFGNNNQSKQISKSIAQNHRMFSLYSLIPCVKMEPYDQQSFIRIMLGPHHTLYIQQCSQQDRLDDYLCTLIDTEQNKIMQDKDDLILLQKKQQTYLWYHKQQNKQDEHQYLVAHQSQCYSITMNSSEFSSHNHIKLIDKDILVLLQTIQQSDKKFHEVITFNMKTKQSFKHCLQNILVKNIDIDIKQMQIVLTVNLIQVGQQNCVIYVIDLNYFIHKLANTKYYKTFTLFKGMYTLSNAPSVASFTKFYKNYYLTINQTSFCKYNKLKVQLQLLYCLDFNNTDQILRGQISNKYLMIVYVQSYRLIDLEASKISAQITYRLQKNAENTIYDLMQLDQNQIIIGIDNIVRSYNLKLEFVVNGFNTRIDVIRQSLNVTIIPIAQVNIQQKLAQKFTLEILYSIQTLEYRGKSIKLLNVPFSAQKYYLEIYQTMFIGSISKYLIFDTFEHQINIINHFQIDQNCFIQLKDQLFLYNYSLLMNDPNIQAPSLLYTNDTSIIIVINNTKKGQVEIEAHPQTIAQRYQHVYHIQQNDQNLKYILVSKSNKIGYIYQRHETGELIFLEYSLNDTLKIIKSSLKVINNENNNNHRICLYLLIHSNTNNSPSLCRQIFFIDVLNKPKEIQQHQTLKLCANAFTIAQNYIIFTKTIISTSKSYYYLCYMNSEYNHNTQCLSLQKIINKQFYIDSIFSYNQIYYLKSSHYERGLQILFVAQRNDAININLQLFIQEQNVKWKISGCYIGLYEQRYKLRNLIKVGKNQGNISYLIVQYSNGFYNKIAYYKFYNYTAQSLYCSQIVNMVAYEPQPNQPYYGVTTLGNKMYNFTQSYFIYEKIYFILNYTSPPPVTYVVIQGLQSQESLQTLGFYSKFIYEVEQKYTILKMSICFGLVILSLIIMRIARQLCDRGIIKWNNSNSTDEDDQVNVSQKILSVDI